MELRSRLAQARGGVLPAVRNSTVPASAGPGLRAFVRYVSLVLVAAVTAGAAGYVVGHVRLKARAARLAAESAGASARDGKARDINAPDMKISGFRALPVWLMPVAHVMAPDPTLPPARRQPGPQSVVSGVQPPGHDPARDPAEIAAKMKLGADLMAAGDVAAARTMFERVAEAGDAHGAFALAETYDPAVLRRMPLRGGITPDPAQARRWYEMARNMGSPDAPERIARLPAQ